MLQKRDDQRIIETKKGFSLTEVLLVIFIMALGIGITLSSFQDTKPMDEVEAAARQLAAMIREAQNNSLTGKQQINGGALTNMCLNGIEWIDDNADGTEFALVSFISDPARTCDTGNDKIVSRSDTFKKVKLSNDQPNSSALYFSVPSGIVSNAGFLNINAVPNSAKIEIQSTVNASIKALVCVYTTGRIEEVFGSANCP